MTSVVFRSKIDLWLIILLLAVVLSITLPLFWEFDWVILVIDIPIILLFYDLLRNTKYVIDDNRLIVKGGFLLCSTYDISSINSISPTRTFLSAPACSMDRMKIEMKGGDIVVISPLRKQEFIEELLKVNPGIEVKS